MIFFICFVLVSSLSCYQCDSKIHSDCIEDFDHSHRSSLTIKSTECDVDAAEYCVKTTGVWGGKSITNSYYLFFVSHDTLLLSFETKYMYMNCTRKIPGI